MARRRGGAAPSRSAPTRPVAAPARPNAPFPARQPPSRAASTAAQPGSMTPARGQTGMQPQQQRPGLFGQMASTAAGVAVGSSIGHAVGNLFGGYGSAPAAAEPANDSMSQQDFQGASASQDNSWGARSCETDARQFTKCLDENGGNMQICGWYLEQLKACQQAASQY
ncbi:MAG: hypothetical protein M1825_004541 [Sarcosagium campestre]|nr:MAG: hypothetical protein M1825_004541 [Sarcosagium campestre]